VSLYLEDVVVGTEFVTGEVTITTDDIIAFASQFDPQPFHTDPDAAKSTFFGGLAASGWHTAALTMRLLVTQGPPIAGGIIGAGGDLAWPTATRPDPDQRRRGASAVHGSHTPVCAAEVMRIRAFAEADTERVVELWTDCELTRPWNDPRRDIARKLTVQPELFLVGEENGEPIATAMIGFDGHRGWVSYLAVDPAHRGRGHAAALMAESERLLIELGCPKIMLMVRADNTAVIGLYEHLDYAAEQTVLMGKRLIPDE
jgi:GNAT superfamily N-acetyltransferase